MQNIPALLFFKSIFSTVFLFVLLKKNKEDLLNEYA